MSSATSPLPREMSSSASSLLPIAEAPVMSTPISSTSRNTPCSVATSASMRERFDLRRTEDLEAERMDEIHVAHLADGGLQRRIAGEHLVAALASCEPGE